jgi:photosystem II stability/assembly factor-like uncharacterized protein
MKNFLAFVILLISLIPLTGEAQWTRTSLPDFGDIQTLTILGGNILAIDIGGVIYRSSDSGASWTKQLGSRTRTTFCNFATIDGQIFAPLYGSGIFVSFDSGVNWTLQNSSFPITTTVALATSGPYLFAGTSYDDQDGIYHSAVYRSIDSGISWTPVSSGLDTSGPLYALQVIDTNLFASNNGVYRSTDNGKSWISVTKHNAFSFAVISSSLFLGTSDSGIFRSTDNGDHWIAVSNGLPGNYTDVWNFAVLDTLLFAATLSGGPTGNVFLSTDFGAHWINEDSGLAANDVKSVAVNHAFVFAGTGNSGLWRRPLSDFFAPSSVSFPQIAGHSIQISQSGDHLFANDEGLPIEIRTSNILGAEVLSQQASGALDVDLSALPAGVYFAVIEAGNDRQVKRIAVVH